MDNSDYIHNGYDGNLATANLRMDMSNPSYHVVTLRENVHFVVGNFEDKAGAKWEESWEHTKSYCGLIEGDRWDDATIREGLIQIMRTGAKPYDLALWLQDNVIN